MQEVLPNMNSEAGKKEQVGEMFDAIAPKYDLLNRILSFGIDKGWRKKLVAQVDGLPHAYILDIATGTGDLAIALAKLEGVVKVVGIDISEGMLGYGRVKVARERLDKIITLQKGDGEHINFVDNTFDIATVSFGVRNFENLKLGLEEIFRTLRPGGTIKILEFSQPQNAFFGTLYRFYSATLLPLIGRLVSRSSAAYSYLPASIKAFPYGKDFTDILNDTGFINTTCQQLSFGIASIYSGTKPA